MNSSYASSLFIKIISENNDDNLSFKASSLIISSKMFQSKLKFFLIIFLYISGFSISLTPPRKLSSNIFSLISLSDTYRPISPACSANIFLEAII